jgi:hypothetical protein
MSVFSWGWLSGDGRFLSLTEPAYQRQITPQIMADYWTFVKFCYQLQNSLKLINLHSPLSVGSHQPNQARLERLLGSPVLPILEGRA